MRRGTPPPRDVAMLLRQVGIGFVVTAAPYDTLHIGSSGLSGALRTAKAALGLHAGLIHGWECAYSFAGDPEADFMAADASTRTDGVAFRAYLVAEVAPDDPRLATRCFDAFVDQAARRHAGATVERTSATTCTIAIGTLAISVSWDEDAGFALDALDHRAGIREKIQEKRLEEALAGVDGLRHATGTAP